MKQAVFLGRFQPLHIGHLAIIDEMLIDGHRPLVIIGGTNKNDERHPYDSMDTVIELHEIYRTSVRVNTVEDYEDWDEWVDAIQAMIAKDAIIYINNKEQDRINFTVRGKEYHNAFYNDMWHDLGYQTKHVTFPEKRNLEHINATDIRNDVEGMKWALHPVVYKYVSSAS